ncbi:response regulator transcription factor [Desulfotruncus arcticus]|uniref:response regulator transcription factor n=1 Tax=Desulfotruncus arcticus TaxID=341036 RepID=UPI000B847E59|nr:response regulator transcription factor [Desulfotruncus arcticus]
MQIPFTGREALSYISNQEYQLIILDLMLPKVDGQEVLRKIREKKTIPVIILSAKDREMDKILGLGLGADDYMTKPFTIGELIARVKAQLRRYMNFSPDATGAEPKVLKYGDLELDLGTQYICYNYLLVPWSVPFCHRPRRCTYQHFGHIGSCRQNVLCQVLDQSNSRQLFKP